MINTNINKTIDLLISDGKFIEELQEQINAYNSPQTNEKQKIEIIKKCSLLNFRIIDYIVSSHLIDMEADLLRLCEEDPIKARKYKDSINNAALAYKKNYQILYDNPSSIFAWFDIMLITYRQFLAIKLDNAPASLIGPSLAAMNISFEDIEFVSSGNDRDVLEQKFQIAKNLNLEKKNVIDFIERCFHWADAIDDILSRQKSDRTIVDIKPIVIQNIYNYCKGEAFDCASIADFEKVITNRCTQPSFKILNKEFFYTLLYAIYSSLGVISQRDAWVHSILRCFDLEDKDYYAAKSRIDSRDPLKKNQYTKQQIRFEEIIKLLQN